jgi:hypothetical protein
VVRHLGEHGGTNHHAILLRGFKLLRGTVPGFCLQSLARLGYPGPSSSRETVLHRGDLNDSAIAIIVEALADLGTPPARDLVREFVQRRPSCSPSRPRCAACSRSSTPARFPTSSRAS